MAEWLAIEEVAKRANLPEKTVRKYLKNFSLLSKKMGTSKKYSSEAVEIVKTIFNMYQEGQATADIKKWLEKRRVEEAKIAKEKEQISSLIDPRGICEKDLSAIIMAQKEAIEQIAASLELRKEQEEDARLLDKDYEIQELKRELAKLRHEYKKDIEERDNKVVTKIRTSFEREPKVPWIQGIFDKIKGMVEEQVNKA